MAANKKRKRYKLQDPLRFFTFIGVVAACILLLILVFQSCGRNRNQESDRPGTDVSRAAETESKPQAEPSSREESAPEPSVPERSAEESPEKSIAEVSFPQEVYQEAADQTVAWTIALANILHGYEIEQEESNADVIPIRYTIVIDAGCGGSDLGNPGIGGIYEKDITRRVAEKLQDQLKDAHPEVEVIMTRRGDGNISNDNRIKKINNSGADLAVSLHCDYFAGSSERRGVAAYYRRTEGPKVVMGEKTVTTLSLAKSAAEVLQKAAVTALSSNDRGISEERYEILNQTIVPTVLLELAYISDQSDYDKITSVGYIQALAEELSESIVRWLADTYPERAEEGWTKPEIIQEESAEESSEEESSEEESSEEESSEDEGEAEESEEEGEPGEDEDSEAEGANNE